MRAQELKHQAKLAEWRQNILECRGQDITVKQWCAAHKVHVSTYYRWEREVFKKAKGQTPTTAGTMDMMSQAAFVELVPARQPTSVEITVPEVKAPVDGKDAKAATIHLGVGSIDVYAGADVEMVAALCKVLTHAE